MANLRSYNRGDIVEAVHPVTGEVVVVQIAFEHKARGVQVRLGASARQEALVEWPDDVHVLRKLERKVNYAEAGEVVDPLAGGVAA